MLQCNITKLRLVIFPYFEPIKFIKKEKKGALENTDYCKGQQFTLMTCKSATTLLYVYIQRDIFSGFILFELSCHPHVKMYDIVGHRPLPMPNDISCNVSKSETKFADLACDFQKIVCLLPWPSFMEKQTDYTENLISLAELDTAANNITGKRTFCSIV